MKEKSWVEAYKVVVESDKNYSNLEVTRFKDELTTSTVVHEY